MDGTNVNAISTEREERWEFRVAPESRVREAAAIDRRVKASQERAKSLRFQQQVGR